MAKFCANCGNQMNDEDNVCSKCGTPVAGAQVAAPAAEATPAQTEASAAVPAAEAAPVQTEAPAAEAAPAQAEAPAAETAPTQAATPTQTAAPQAAPAQAAAPAGKTISAKKLITIVGIALAAIFVLCIVIGVVSSMNSYKATLDKMVKALKKDDVATLESLSSSVSDEVYGAWYDDLTGYYDEQISNTLDKYEDSVGEVKKISYEITDETEFSKRRVNELKDKLVDSYNMDPSDIKKVVDVSLQLTVKGSKKSAAYNVYDLYLIKENGGWKIYYGTLNY